MRRLISDSTWAWQYWRRSAAASPGRSTNDPATSVPAADQRVAGRLDHRAAEPVALGDGRRDERAVGPGPAQHQVLDRMRGRLGEAGGHARRHRDPQTVPEPGHVLGDRDHLLPGDPDLDQPAVQDQLLQRPARGSKPSGWLRAASSVRRERPGRPDQVEQLLGAESPAARR